jgi:hypothetical protein
MDLKTLTQCCQLMENDFGQINRKFPPLVKNFDREHYLFIEAVLQTAAAK